MARNLDLTALRSFVAVADTGGVTKAAGLLNLTQSAVSMQLKRLEESLDASLLDRSARTIGLTSQGELLLSYARRMLTLNDEIYGKLTATQYECEITLGVPHDIVYPVIPTVLKQFSAAYPRVRVHLVSSFTRELVANFKQGKVDVILTTEDTVDAGGETLTQIPLIWVGAPGGQIWKQRPLRLAYEEHCIFRKFVQRRLDEAGIPWDMVVESNSSRTIEATVSADMAVHTMLEGTQPRHFEQINHQGSLPTLRSMNVNMYQARLDDGPVIRDLAGFIRDGFATMRAPAMA
ncbi:LysR family transcriptional regulator [Loktanella sp. D2R18]|uniref:LysR family transcriptional regulator n=1 Tax=Rhodobacterales TaxID=204455 RepID=UPI000DE93FDC|nr:MULTISPECIES: LysR family transcriptional regulator [Rhodobacterales]MDO6589223.1 LysR family transcriptional regulator [Yoonia sp. 1_MG-2023]RBW45351.1 LysR family transcriptional regulator [Loktanella sp. D2R18]